MYQMHNFKTGNSSQKRVLNILLIEDDMIEVMKLKRTIVKLELNHNVTVANNGEEGLDILEKKDRLPHIILLDLNMPKMNGLEFLRIVKDDERLKYIPVIILTTSSNQRDLLECFKLGVQGYMTKPVKYEEYVSKIDKLQAYWSNNQLLSM